MNARNPLQIDDPCYIFCIQMEEEGGAFWTDDGSEIAVEGMTLLKCENGALIAMKKAGGIYLHLSVG